MLAPASSPNGSANGESGVVVLDTGGGTTCWE